LKSDFFGSKLLYWASDELRPVVEIESILKQADAFPLASIPLIRNETALHAASKHIDKEALDRLEALLKKIKE